MSRDDCGAVCNSCDVCKVSAPETLDTMTFEVPKPSHDSAIMALVEDLWAAGWTCNPLHYAGVREAHARLLATGWRP